ncbi:potassium transporter Kup [Caballeronia concitans]|uniref:Probable potassium transport system protein Kup n=1 Tax=Caballeronia concitans TaxID=1777133 RepID=A0A658R3E7_9BURK|nr:potassium transporter Kup [Caballeronia concitans]KIG01697.1 Low affinity potassium transport system protein kup [Burkholderia sp. MR1]SAL46716.1 potassium uptake protein [Caballeronia concitans]
MSTSALQTAAPAKRATPTLALGAIGVVFGDIGTSPLYTLRECLKAAGGVNPANVYGIVSLILWSIIVVVTLKYVCFVMRADNDGEGGILALTALASGVAPVRLRRLLLTLGVFGAAMFYGDSMITPAISVISAVEGVTLVDPHLSTWIVPIALVILTALFRVQKRGTGAVGKVFGPIMLIWFLTLAVTGVMNIASRPGILQAVSPAFALEYLAHAPGTAFIVLGSVFLALTGGEALYADMGHFGKRPIRLSWLLLVFPALVLNYFGQAALVLNKPSVISQPFFESVPAWALIPLVLLAALATVIASQAVISGAFSMTKQAVQLGMLPRIPVVHTSSHEVGQVYVPFINLTLYVAVVFLVLFFRSSDNLAAAYGIAVASTMLLTTLLMYFVTHCLWRWRPLATVAVIGPMALVDALFVASNANKIMDGGWFPLLAGAALFTVMTTWHKGRETIVQRIKSESLELAPLIKSLTAGEHPVMRTQGTAVFPGGVARMTPTAFLHNLKHNGVMHRINIFLAGSTDNTPHVSDDVRVSVESLGHGCYAVTVRHGFMEIPNVPAILELVEKQIPDWRYDPADVSFFLGRDTIVATGKSHAMPLWRERLFAFLVRNAAQAAEYYSLPPNRVVEMGGQINL